MKKLVQFNELVFNQIANITESPLIATDFRVSKFEYANRHGDYSPEKVTSRKVDSKSFETEIKVDLKRFNCDDRSIVDQFILDNFYKVGRLWAVQGDILLWAIAKVESISEGFEDTTGYLTYAVKFYLPQGIWHVADSTATYFDDYYTCDISNCYESLERPLCECCWCNIGLAPVKMCPPCHGERLCEIPHGKLAGIIGHCGSTKKISYSCDDQTATGTTKSGYGDTSALLEFDAKTLYATDDIVIEICGEFTDLVIDWGQDRSMVEGTYKGKTTINGGLVRNECDYLDIDKFYHICKTTGDGNPDCKASATELGTYKNGGGLVRWEAKKGTNSILFYGLAEQNIQTINIYIGGIAI